MFRRTSKPFLYFCHVDDTNAIFHEKSDCDSFLQAQNSLNPSLIFISKKCADGKVLFPNVLVEKASKVSHVFIS